ncbi:hypothetical protein BKA65DRAFT_30058 [Rhexocercosporidium sp. MPI-PUGE-AT-0058]|nr:hypothetical protein BKA65DRAFT_30058 [Rhexocercosporidium sp. MPI-PUGE-AT-0058]
MFSHALVLALVTALLLTSFPAMQANAQLDLSSISLDQRKAWCRSQISACDELCSSVTSNNDCTSETLSYNCECTNYPTPDLTSYSGTMPTLICLQLLANCKKVTDGSILQCQLQSRVHCGTKFPVDFEPPTTTSSKAKSTSVTSSSTNQAGSAFTTSSDRVSVAKTDRLISTSFADLDRTTSSSISSKITDTLVTSTRPTPTINNDTWSAAQNTTTPIPTDEPAKGTTDGQVLGLALGIPAGLFAFVLIFLWTLARWKQRSPKDQKEAAEADQRSIRSNRGSVLVMNEMTADSIRNHLSKLEMKENRSTEQSRMLPMDSVGSRTSPAELPSHFPRSHSRIFEME